VRDIGLRSRSRRVPDLPCRYAWPKNPFWFVTPFFAGWSQIKKSGGACEHLHLGHQHFCVTLRGRERKPHLLEHRTAIPTSPIPEQSTTHRVLATRMLATKTWVGLGLTMPRVEEVIAVSCWLIEHTEGNSESRWVGSNSVPERKAIGDRCKWAEGVLPMTSITCSCAAAGCSQS